jgi:ligand-binding sensor domain-containing protein
VHAIADAGGIVYLGARGLWAGTAAANRLRRVQDFPDQEVTALTRSPAGELLAGTASGVLARRGGRWRILWPIGNHDGQVNALFFSNAGPLLVATRDGYLVVDPRGQILYRELQGKWVTGFTQLPDGELWVATKKSGVHVKTGGRWRRIGYPQGLSADRLSALAVDHQQRLWLGIHGDGVSVVAAAALQRFAVADDAPAPLAGAAVFADACEAAASVLGSGGESGAVALESVAGRGIVFFNSRQVCPEGIGYRRDAGTLVSVADGTVRLHAAGKQTLLPLPARAVGAMPTAAFVDSNGGLWLGFRKRGLFVFNNGRWRSFANDDQLLGNAVRAISEDRTGAIWVASDPSVDPTSARRLPAGVHRYAAKRWTHFRPAPPDAPVSAQSARQHPAAVAAHGIRELADGRVAIATNGGLSIFDQGSFDNYLRAAEPGLESNFIADVVEDAAGRLWMTHGHWGHGITWKSGFLFHNRGSRDGLFHDRLRRVAFDAEGNVWLQSSYGQTAIYPLSSVLD